MSEESGMEPEARRDDRRRDPMIGDLVVAMLAVNNWPLEKAFLIRDRLEDEGLFEPERILAMEHAALFEALKRAGYQKSDYVVGLLTDRLRHMATRLQGPGRQELAALVQGRRLDELRSFLLAIKGVGPAVYHSFLILRGLGSPRVSPDSP